jgi:hypothetical protein
MAAGLDPDRYRAVAVLPGDGPLASDLAAAGVEVHVRRLAVLRRALFHPPGLVQVAARAAADAAGLGRLVRERQVALVHSNTSVTQGGAAAARRAGVPHVWSVREIYTDFERWWPAYRRFLLAAADALLCSSEAVRAQFGDDARARVVHEGVTGVAARAPRERARAELGLAASSVRSAREAVEGADVAILATRSETPVIEAGWIAPGAHVNTVGPKAAGACETPPELADGAAVAVSDSPAQAAAYGAPFFTSRELTHLGAVLAGDAGGRRSDSDITLYASTGLAGSEVVIARRLLEPP